MIRAPAGAFALDRASRFPPVFISAGVGVTPMVAMLKSWLDHTRDGGAPPTWVHCTRSGSTHVLREEIAALLAARPNARKLIFYSCPAAEDLPGVHYDEAGRMTADRLLARLVPVRFDVAGREIEIPAQLCEYYLCGPQSWLEMLRPALKAWGVPEAHIRTESFARPARNAAAPAVERAEVYFARSGVHATWERDSEYSLLELAEANGLAPEHMCRAGTCHSCRCTLTEGAVVYDTPPADLRPGTVLICCSRPGAQRIVIEL